MFVNSLHFDSTVMAFTLRRDRLCLSPRPLLWTFIKTYWSATNKHQYSICYYKVLLPAERREYVLRFFFFPPPLFLLWEKSAPAFCISAAGHSSWLMCFKCYYAEIIHVVNKCGEMCVYLRPPTTHTHSERHANEKARQGACLVLITVSDWGESMC